MNAGARIKANKIYIDDRAKGFYHIYSDGKLIYTTSGNIIDLGGLLTKGEHRVGVCLFCLSGREDRLLFDTKVTVA